ncbi:MAG: hypothetical protein FWD97_03005 [Defluviitaleaceae bacterium]|nr:hypothetical protein [Defluviitaleaceae bacterium]
MNNTPFPELSKDFTIEDIRKIRDWSSERFTNMTRKEIAEDINSGARDFLALVEDTRQVEHQDGALAVV